jgi:hypothetical protein
MSFSARWPTSTPTTRAQGYRDHDKFMRLLAEQLNTGCELLWVISFKLDVRDTVRLLHRWPERGYTDDLHQALRGPNKLTVVFV